MTKRRWLRTDSRTEAVRSLEWCAIQAEQLQLDAYHWKWVMISLHNAVQAFMVLALDGGNGFMALKPEVTRKWLVAHESGGDYPQEKLDYFLDLFEKVKSPTNFNLIGTTSFSGGKSVDESMKKLNEYRNEFIHFVPKFWSLEVTGLPRICADCLSVIEVLGRDQRNFAWHKQIHERKVRSSMKRLRAILVSL